MDNILKFRAPIPFINAVEQCRYDRDKQTKGREVGTSEILREAVRIHLRALGYLDEDDQTIFTEGREA